MTIVAGGHVRITCAHGLEHYEVCSMTRVAWRLPGFSTMNYNMVWLAMTQRVAGIELSSLQSSTDADEVPAADAPKLPGG